MNDAVIVGGLKARRHLQGNTGGFPHCQLSLFIDVSLQRNALHQLHHDKIDTVLFSHIIHVYDIGMGQPCRRLGLHPEFGQKNLVILEFRLQNLDGHKTVQFMIFGLIYIRHSTRADAV